MSNGDVLNDQLEFKERLKAMSSDERLLFVAEQTYTLTIKLDDHCKEGVQTNKKAGAISGGVTAGIIAVIIGVVEHFRGR